MTNTNSSEILHRGAIRGIQTVTFRSTDTLLQERRTRGQLTIADFDIETRDGDRPVIITDNEQLTLLHRHMLPISALISTSKSQEVTNCLNNLAQNLLHTSFGVKPLLVSFPKVVVGGLLYQEI